MGSQKVKIFTYYDDIANTLIIRELSATLQKAHFSLLPILGKIRYRHVAKGAQFHSIFYAIRDNARIAC